MGLDGTNEIDIEWSKCEQTDSDVINLGSIVFPRNKDGLIVSDKKKHYLNGTYTMNTFTWSHQGVKTEYYHGRTTDDQNKFFEWETPHHFADSCPRTPVPIYMNV
ncbi:unnamed protein product [Rotaria socialis]|uniref:Uncharacterized protein n=1 Tax=Rotaria socialis TaxID=392032 RepID=A0A817Z1V9_9BILA|nr:unnamed protein product [Rotaria socialis]CAF3437297.1 unnamed protein product [Rotaria socialis]CAF4274978.1 unnamed protein product [Rotaria socialis]CAF4438891.1 unnamed protein product [Rotaria socialis]